MIGWIVSGVIIFIVLCYFVVIIDKFKVKRLSKKYNDETEDKSRDGEEERRRLNLPVVAIAAGESGVKGSAEPGKQKLLPPTDTKSDGEDDSGSGKAGGFAKFFRKLKQR